MEILLVNKSFQEMARQGDQVASKCLEQLEKHFRMRSIDSARCHLILPKRGSLHIDVMTPTSWAMMTNFSGGEKGPKDVVLAIADCSETFTEAMLDAASKHLFCLLLANTAIEACEALQCLGQQQENVHNQDEQSALIDQCVVQFQRQLVIGQRCMDTLIDRVDSVQELAALDADQMIAYIGIDVDSADQIERFLKIDSKLN